jgi:hypothetical protein
LIKNINKYAKIKNKILIRKIKRIKSHQISGGNMIGIAFLFCKESSWVSLGLTETDLRYYFFGWGELTV